MLSFLVLEFSQTYKLTKLINSYETKNDYWNSVDCGEMFHGARLDAFCGGIRMDLREATITEDEEIEIHTFCGGVELFVPQTVNVEVKSRSFIGGVGNHATRIVGKDTPCLHIIADNFLGGIDIKN